MRRKLSMLFLQTAACKVEAAPANTDELFHRLWAAFPVEAGINVDPLVASVPDVIDVDALIDDHEQGGQTPLSPDEIAGLPFTDADGQPTDAPDPSLATPLYVIDRFGCAADRLEEILTFPDQNAIYETYDSYERRFHEDRQAFLDGDIDVLTWDGTIAVTTFPLNYEYDFRTELRRIPVGEEAGVPGNVVWMTRNFLPTPADWHGSDGYFKQDYQLELFLPVEGGDIVHLYPVWRELMALGQTLDNDAAAGINFGQTISFDKKTADTCVNGLPTP